MSNRSTSWLLLAFLVCVAVILMLSSMGGFRAAAKHLNPCWNPLVRVVQTGCYEPGKR